MTNRQKRKPAQQKENKMLKNKLEHINHRTLS